MLELARAAAGRGLHRRLKNCTCGMMELLPDGLRAWCPDIRATLKAQGGQLAL